MKSLMVAFALLPALAVAQSGPNLSYIEKGSHSILDEQKDWGDTPPQTNDLTDYLKSCLRDGVHSLGLSVYASRDSESINNLLMGECPAQTVGWQDKCTASGKSENNCMLEETLMAQKAIVMYGH